MKKATQFLTICFLLLGIFNTQAQKIISKQSQSKKFDLKPEYKRELPPNLYASLDFKDANSNGILEAEEKAMLEIELINFGKGNAQDLDIIISDNFLDTAFHYKQKDKIYLIHPSDTVKIKIPISAGFHIKTGEHKLEIQVKELYGYDMDPAFLVLNTLEFQKAKLNLAGIEIIDFGESTVAITEDGLLQAGEQVKVKVVVQNIGQNIAANTKYKIETSDPNIYIENTEGELGNFIIGEIKDFHIIVSPNKRVSSKGDLPIYLTLTEERNLGNIHKKTLPIQLNQRPSSAQTLTVEPDIAKLTKQVARFEYNSNKIKSNIGALKNIASVNSSKTIRKNSVAIVMGIEHYDKLPPAPYADKDADIIKEYFKKRLGVETVYTYKNNEIEGFFFDDYFNPVNGELNKAIIKGETELFVFYSGHGVPNKDGDKIYLFPSDGKIERIETQGYDINKFYQNLLKLEAKSTTIFIDACFSGSSKATEIIPTKNLLATKGVMIRPKILEPWKTDSTFCVFNSSSLNQTSLGFDPTQTGLFTYYLCAGLKGEADSDKNQQITTGELGDYLLKNVEETSVKILDKQTPEFHGNRNIILMEF